MSDTINERPGFGETDPPPPRREPTGRLRVDRQELEELVSKAADRAVSRRAPSQTRMIIAAVLAALGGSGATYGTQRIADAQAAATVQEQVRQGERHDAEQDRRIEGIGALSRDIAALSAKVDGMAATSTSRFDRIENRLERLRR